MWQHTPTIPTLGSGVQGYPWLQIKFQGQPRLQEETLMRDRQTEKMGGKEGHLNQGP